MNETYEDYIPAITKQLEKYYKSRLKIPVLGRPSLPQSLKDFFVKVCVIPQKTQLERMQELARASKEEDFLEVSMCYDGLFGSQKQRNILLKDLMDLKEHKLSPYEGEARGGKYPSYEPHLVEVKKALILGQAGIGKTSLAYHLSHQWALAKKGWKTWKKRYEWLLYLPLRNFLSENDGWTGYTSMSDILRLMCPALAGVSEEEFTAAYTELENQGKILLLLDGYDEITTELKKNKPLKRVIESLFQSNKVILFSRPYSLHQLNELFTPERSLWVTGFNPKQIKRYVKNFFTYVVGSDKEKAGEELIDFIENKPKLLSLCAIPIHLEFICTASADQPMNESCSSITEVYEHVLTSTCFRLLGKHQDISDLLPEEAKEEYLEALMLLEYFGYQSLQKGEIFLKLESAIEYCNLRHGKKIWKPGELAQEQKALGFIQPNNATGKYDGWAAYFFSHLTLRDFFAARYIADCFSKGHVSPSWKIQHLWSHPASISMDEFIRENQFDDRFKLVWPFVCGFLRKESNIEGLKRFLRALLEGVQEEDIFGVETTCLLISCLDEAQELFHNMPEFFQEKFGVFLGHQMTLMLSSVGDLTYLSIHPLCDALRKTHWMRKTPFFETVLVNFIRESKALENRYRRIKNLAIFLTMVCFISYDIYRRLMDLMCSVDPKAELPIGNIVTAVSILPIKLIEEWQVCDLREYNKFTLSFLYHLGCNYQDKTILDQFFSLITSEKIERTVVRDFLTHFYKNRNIALSTQPTNEKYLIPKWLEILYVYQKDEEIFLQLLSCLTTFSLDECTSQAQTLSEILKDLAPGSPQYLSLIKTLGVFFLNENLNKKKHLFFEFTELEGFLNLSGIIDNNGRLSQLIKTVKSCNHSMYLELLLYLSGVLNRHENRGTVWYFIESWFRERQNHKKNLEIMEDSAETYYPKIVEGFAQYTRELADGDANKAIDQEEVNILLHHMRALPGMVVKGCFDELTDSYQCLWELLCEYEDIQLPLVHNLTKLLDIKEVKRATFGFYQQLLHLKGFPDQFLKINLMEGIFLKDGIDFFESYDMSFMNTFFIYEIDGDFIRALEILFLTLPKSDLTSENNQLIPALEYVLGKFERVELKDISDEIAIHLWINVSKFYLENKANINQNYLLKLETVLDLWREDDLEYLCWASAYTELFYGNSLTWGMINQLTDISIKWNQIIKKPFTITIDPRETLNQFLKGNYIAQSPGVFISNIPVWEVKLKEMIKSRNQASLFETPAQLHRGISIEQLDLFLSCIEPQKLVDMAANAEDTITCIKLLAVLIRRLPNTTLVSLENNTLYMAEGLLENTYELPKKVHFWKHFPDAYQEAIGVSLKSLSNRAIECLSNSTQPTYEVKSLTERGSTLDLSGFNIREIVHFLTKNSGHGIVSIDLSNCDLEDSDLKELWPILINLSEDLLELHLADNRLKGNHKLVRLIKSMPNLTLLNLSSNCIDRKGFIHLLKKAVVPHYALEYLYVSENLIDSGRIHLRNQMSLLQDHRTLLKIDVSGNCLLENCEGILSEPNNLFSSNVDYVSGSSILTKYTSLLCNAPLLDTDQGLVHLLAKEDAVLDDHAVIIVEFLQPWGQYFCRAYDLRTYSSYGVGKAQIQKETIPANIIQWLEQTHYKADTYPLARERINELVESIELDINKGEFINYCKLGSRIAKLNNCITWAASKLEEVDISVDVGYFLARPGNSVRGQGAENDTQASTCFLF